MKKYNDYILCYIDRGLAYFTNKKLEEQWGDDWNDTPYEYKAGEPYYENEDEIVKVYFIAYEYDEPCEMHFNSPYSVEDINKKEIPWLRPAFENSYPPVFAGTKLKDFINIIKDSGGEIFIPLTKS